MGTDGFSFSHVEEEDDGEVDDSGVEDSDIKLVMDQAQVGISVQCNKLSSCY
jgi:NACalpha-BTF3-like transcription factor